MKKNITLILFLIISIFIINIEVNAEKSNNLVNIYFFHSDSCSHCKEETKFLKQLENKYNNIKIYKYEVHEKENYQLLNIVNELYKTKINSVPITIIGNEVYTGYSEKSQITFIKTIEYFSRYGYTDKLGKYLQVDLPTYEINSSNITLKDFIETYHNYNILGLKTSKLDWTSISLLLGLSLSLNVISIISIILVVIISNKSSKENEQLLLKIFYITIFLFQLLSSLINNNILSIIIYQLLLILIIIDILNFKNKKQTILISIIIIISVITNYIITNIINNDLNIFRNILDLYNLTGLNKLSYYSNLIIITTVLNILIMYLTNIIIKKFNII